MFEYQLFETPEDNDSDNVRFFLDGAEVRGYAFRGKEADDHICIIRCPKCEAENYGPAIASGSCAWCGFNTERDATERSS